VSGKHGLSRHGTHLRGRLGEDGLHRVRGGINSDPVIGERKVRPGPDAGHVTSDARPPGEPDPMRWFRVAGFAGGIVAGRPGFERRVRRVARHAAQAARALAKAAAGGEQQRLVPRVPRILEIGRIACGGGHAVAVPAEAVHVIGRDLPRIGHTDASRVSRVGGGGTMAAFAAHTEFVRNDGVIARER